MKRRKKKRKPYGDDDDDAMAHIQIIDILLFLYSKFVYLCALLLLFAIDWSFSIVCDRCLHVASFISWMICLHAMCDTWVNKITYIIRNSNSNIVIRNHFSFLSPRLLLQFGVLCERIDRFWLVNTTTCRMQCILCLLNFVAQNDAT